MRANSSAWINADFQDTSLKNLNLIASFIGYEAQYKRIILHSKGFSYFGSCGDIDTDNK